MSAPENPPQYWNWAPPPPAPPRNSLSPVKVIVIVIAVVFAAGSLFVTGFYSGVGYTLGVAYTDDVYLDPYGDPAGKAPGPAEAPFLERDEAEDYEEPEEIGAFGETSTWDDGLAITVTDVEIREPSEFGPTAEFNFGGSAIILVTMELTNGTVDPFNRNNGLGLVVATYGQDRTYAPQVYMDNPLQDIRGVIEPGETVSGQYAFGVPPSQVTDFEVMVVPSFRHHGASWRGNAEAPIGPTA